MGRQQAARGQIVARQLIFWARQIIPIVAVFFLKRQFLYYNINSWNNTPLMVRLTFYFYFETGNWVSCHWLFWSFLSLHLTTDRSPEEKQCVLQLWLVILNARVYSHWMRQYLCAPTMTSHHVWMTDHVDVKFQKRIRNSNII